MLKQGVIKVVRKPAKSRNTAPSLVLILVPGASHSQINLTSLPQALAGLVADLQLPNSKVIRPFSARGPASTPTPAQGLAAQAAPPTLLVVNLKHSQEQVHSDPSGDRFSQ